MQKIDLEDHHHKPFFMIVTHSKVLLCIFCKNYSRTKCRGYSNSILWQILIQSVCETMVPKLVAEDIPLLFSLLSDVFPGIEYTRAQMSGLKEEIRKVCHLE